MPASRHRNSAHCREAPLYWPSQALVRASLFGRAVSSSCWKMCYLWSPSVVGCDPSTEGRRLPPTDSGKARRGFWKQDQRLTDPPLRSSRPKPPSGKKRSWNRRDCCPCPCPYLPTLCQNNLQSELQPKVSGRSKGMGSRRQSMAKNWPRKSGWAGVFYSEGAL